MLQIMRSSVAVALCLSSAAAFAPKAASRPTVAVAAMPSQDELKKQVGYQAIDDYVGSRVPGARRAARHRARRDDPR